MPQPAKTMIFIGIKKSEISINGEYSQPQIEKLFYLLGTSSFWTKPNGNT
jgi:hypothetical protein